jgi:taurine dioxygenase
MPLRSLEIQPLNVGARVHGVDYDKLDAKAASVLYDLWLEYGFLVFSGVDSIERHLQITRCFGELEIHPFPEVRFKENPFLIELGGQKAPAAMVYDGTEVRLNRIPWHRDTAYTPGICKGAMLRMVEVPPEEGETLVADTAAAYDDLSADVKDRLVGLEYKATLRLGSIDQTRPGAIWKTVREATAEEDPRGKIGDKGYDDSANTRYPSVVHPALLEHPESGRKCIFLSPTYVDYFIGLEPAESQDLLVYLTDHMTKPKYVYKHSWTVDDAIIWDNRRCMHAAVGNRVDHPRRGLRSTLAGSLQTGRYFDPNAVAPDLQLAD